MKYNDLIYLNMMILFTPHGGSLNPQQSLRREIRFTRLDTKFANKSSGTILESTIKTLPQNKQAIYLHSIVHEKLFQFSAQFGVYKCKEFYVDCINIITYDIEDVCSKLDAVTYFWSNANSKGAFKKCPIFGEYYYKNLTIDSEKFVSLFSLPTENWMEYTWRIHMDLKRSDKSHFSLSLLDFYVLQFRNRNRKL